MPAITAPAQREKADKSCLIDSDGYLLQSTCTWNSPKR
jgi:hypothetical protein